jgi:hypothetical protein
VTDPDGVQDLLEYGSQRRLPWAARTATCIVAAAVGLLVVAHRPDVIDGRGSAAISVHSDDAGSTAPIPSPVRGYFFVP